jgi:hypothetical protein
MAYPARARAPPGGLLEGRGSYFAEAMQRHLRREYPGASIVLPGLPPEHAAALLALRLVATPLPIEEPAEPGP